MQGKSSEHPGYAVHVSTYVSGQRIRRNGFEAMGRSQNSDQGLPAANPGKTGGDYRDSNVADHAVGTPGADNFPVSFVIASTADRNGFLNSRNEFFESDAGAHFPIQRHRYENRSAPSGKSFSITTRSRRSVSTCSKWAPISRPASGAIMSTGSTSKGAVTK